MGHMSCAQVIPGIFVFVCWVNHKTNIWLVWRLHTWSDNLTHLKIFTASTLKKYISIYKYAQPGTVCDTSTLSAHNKETGKQTVTTWKLRRV